MGSPNASTIANSRACVIGAEVATNFLVLFRRLAFPSMGTVRFWDTLNVPWSVFSSVHVRTVRLLQMTAISAPLLVSKEFVLGRVSRLKPNETCDCRSHQRGRRVGWEGIATCLESLFTEVGAHAWGGYHFICIRELSRSGILPIMLCIVQPFLHNQALSAIASGVYAQKINDQAPSLSLACMAVNCAFSSLHKREDARESLRLFGWKNRISP